MEKLRGGKRRLKYARPEIVEVMQSGAEGDACADGTGHDACETGVSAFFSCINGDGPQGG